MVSKEKNSKAQMSLEQGMRAMAELVGGQEQRRGKMEDETRDGTQAQTTSPVHGDQASQVVLPLPLPASHHPLDAS